MPRSSTSARARCRMRPSAFSARAGEQVVEVGAGRERRAEPERVQRLGELRAILRAEARQLDVPSRRRNTSSRQASAGGSPASASTATKSQRRRVAVRQPDRAHAVALGVGELARRRASSAPRPRPRTAAARSASDRTGASTPRRGRPASVMREHLVLARSASRTRGIIPCVFSFAQALIARDVQRAGVQRQRRPGRVAVGRARRPGADRGCRRRPRAGAGVSGASTRPAPRASPRSRPRRTTSSARVQAVRREDDVPVAVQQRIRAASSARSIGLPYRLPRSACSRSMASNSALKLPSPKPRAPWRSITSRKTVGRSPIGLVKICSR